MIEAFVTIEAFVDPLFHKYVPPPVAVIVPDNSEQKLELPDIVTDGLGRTVTVTDEDEVHPPPL